MEASHPTNKTRLKRRWHYTIETLTPVHIGTGEDPLREGMDYLRTSKDVLVLDVQRALERIYQRASTRKPTPKKQQPEREPVGGLAAQLLKIGFRAEEERTSAHSQNSPTEDPVTEVLRRLASGLTVAQAMEGGLLEPRDFERPGEPVSVTKYVLVPRSGTTSPLPDLEPPEILPTKKDGLLGLYPYIPGSSLKGALRTVLAERMFAQRQEPLDLAEINIVSDRRGRSDPRWADNKLEHEMFGPDPNRDLMRSFFVGDSQTAKASPTIEVTGTYSITQGRLEFKQGFFTAIEAIREGTTLNGTLALDLHLFGETEQGELHFSQEASWLSDMVAHCNDRAQSLIEEELAFYRLYGPGPLVAFYNNMQTRLNSLTSSQCLLQLGWGTGWMAKTLGPKLTQEAVFPDIRRLYSDTMNRRNTATFPKTRHLVLGGREYKDVISPLGWVILKVAEES